MLNSIGQIINTQRNIFNNGSLNKYQYKMPVLSDMVSFSGRKNQNNKHLFLFDLDGTFIEGSDSEIKQAVSLIDEHNGILTYNTGRSLDGFIQGRKNLAEKGINLPFPKYLIINNGQSIYKVNNGEFIPDKEWQCIIEKANFEISTVIDLLKGLAQKKKYLFTEEELKSKIKDNEAFQRYKEIDPDFHKSKISYYTWHNRPHIVITPGLSDLDKHILRTMRNNGIRVRLVKYYFPKFKIDTLPEDLQMKSRLLRSDEHGGQHAIMLNMTDKGTAAEYLRNKLHIAKENVFAAGDEGNDISMTRYGYNFISVQNADSLLRTHILSLPDKLRERCIQASKDGTAGIIEVLQGFFRNK